MAVPVKLPRLGQGMESGTIVRWLKEEGDRVERGDPLYEVDTEKVTQEVEAEAAGVLLRIAVREGEVPVGAVLAFIGEPGEELPEPVPAAPAGDGRRAEPAPPAEAPAAPPAPPPAPGGRVKASPLARRLARERGVDLASLVGTGPEGRIVAEDVERAAAAPAPAPAEAERLPLTSLRRTIARRLAEAWQVPVFQLETSADMGRALDLLERRRALDPDLRLTVTDLLVKACAHALVRHREVNVQLVEDALLRFPRADIGIAVATDRGLLVPVLRGAERSTLAEIAAARTELVERARAGTLRREDLEGGTFTVSNLGMYGVERFTAVLNPPQAAILAVGRIEERPVARDGRVVARPMVTLTATFDHRAVDGAPAAAFLATVKALLEEPGLAL